MKTALLLATVALGVPHVLGLGPAERVSWPESPYTISIDDRLNSTDSATLHAIIDETLKVITSDTFARHLVRVEQQNLWLDDDGSTMSPREVADVYTGHHQVMRPVPTTVRISRNPFKRSPSTGMTRRPPVTSTITLTKASLRRWRKGTVTSRSCAVNTLAHEMTHTISESLESGSFVFSDRGHEDHEDQAFASYVVGSVAQCTMLERENALTMSFAECVEHWGVNFTNGNGCG